jgi:predicted unusual protein kinase regulating ubiquinone biosynthesis (AarF/ABC1/UbiB family)
MPELAICCRSAERMPFGVMDFGLVGELTERDRTHLTRRYIGVIALDADSIIDGLIRMRAVRCDWS